MGRDPKWGRLAKIWGRKILIACKRSCCLVGRSGYGMFCLVLLKNLIRKNILISS